MSTIRGGRHEHGQNFLTDPTVISAVIDHVSCTEGRIVEIGPGRGALTAPMQRLDRPITAIEIDARLAADLHRLLPRTTVVHGDFLRYRLPTEPHTVVGNLPFHLTTAILRKLLHAPNWTDAILLTQWEVARRRAGVGGSTMMTAQWMPWYEFDLKQRVPSTAFSPRPSVDAGLLTVTRRSAPLLPHDRRKPYAAFIHAVYTGRGHGLLAVICRATGRTSAEVRPWMSASALRGNQLPRDLNAAQWVDAFQRFA
jgi:23S rRNA (adenine-N6)-dimethyltransferase